MRIVTYNVNSINARLPNLLRWLGEAAPDVVCLQELKAPQENFPEAAIRGAGYGVIWHGQKSWNGVAILAKNSQPHEVRRVLPGDPDDSHSRSSGGLGITFFWRAALAQQICLALYRSLLGRQRKCADPSSLRAYASPIDRSGWRARNREGIRSDRQAGAP